jgi:hypothetical protein
MLKIVPRIGLYSNTTGMDSPELCLDKEHYFNYKKKVEYQYNSRGFRDHEWPEDLSNVIWCVGDSFTEGLGQPFDETWPCLLQEKTGRRCINIGQNGASNDTIRMRVQDISEAFNPKDIVIMWSYLHRRNGHTGDVHHDPNSFGDIEDLENFSKNLKTVDQLPTNIIHTIIPNSIDGNRQLPYFMQKVESKLKIVEQIDWARDHHHFDIQTSAKIVDWILGEINE